ncbi:MAG: hypothetical protein AAF291_10875 [Pseudomonadota bacterium]
MDALLALIATLSLASSAQATPAHDKDRVGSGQCFYADRYAPLLGQGVVFADCDSAAIERDGDRAVFRFRNSELERPMDFRARLEGGRWKIDAVRARVGGWQETTGTCTIYRNQGAISTLTCITERGATLYAANFEVGRGQ